MKPSLYKIIFDMLMVHDHAFAKSVPEKVRIPQSGLRP
jgi:condensin complex subunit 3